MVRLLFLSAFGFALVSCSNTTQNTLDLTKRGPVTVGKKANYFAKDGKRYVVAMVAINSAKLDFVTASVGERRILPLAQGEAARERYKAVAMELLSEQCGKSGKSAAISDLKPAQQETMRVRRGRTFWAFSRKCV